MIEEDIFLKTFIGINPQNLTRLILNHTATITSYLKIGKEDIFIVGQTNQPSSILMDTIDYNSFAVRLQVGLIHQLLAMPANEVTNRIVPFSEMNNLLDKSSDTFNYMVNSSKKQEEKFFGKTFNFIRMKDDSKSYHVHVTKCMYFEFFKKNMAAELMEIACKWDLISWSCGIKPQKHKVVFERPFTLGLNGRNCEFNFDKTE